MYETSKFPYISSHTYTPDFQLSLTKFVETKGLFSAADRSKHLKVREQNPQLKILFVFQNPYQRLTRKSTTTYADWCDKHNFKWIAADNMGKYTSASLLVLLEN